MNTPELDLQLWLAKQLPERILVWEIDDPATPEYIFMWQQSPALSSPPPEIKDTEWPYIVGLVEGKLKEGDKAVYANQLFIEFREGESWDKASIRLVFFPMICASWPQRATALKKVMGEGV